MLHLTAPETKYAASLDLAALIKTSHSMAEENNWQQLAVRLMHILCENAGAQSGALIMTRDSGLYLEVAVKTAAGEFITLPPAPLAEQKSIPPAIVQYVSRTARCRCWPTPARKALRATRKSPRKDPLCLRLASAAGIKPMQSSIWKIT